MRSGQESSRAWLDRKLIRIKEIREFFR